MNINIDDILAIGISHNELSSEERELFIKSHPEKIIDSLFKDGKIKGYVNLSTCLRVEFYLQVDSSFSKSDLGELFKDAQIKRGEEACEYLFKVSCGFYSVIKGEDQILAQIKKSYSLAFENHTTTTSLNTLFNKAIELGKKFRTESKISHNALSLEAISLKFIKMSVENLKDKNILILGVGDLAQSILELLIKEGIKNITITNRTIHKALELKNSFNVNVITFDKKYDATVENDIIISATSAPHLVLTKEKLGEKLKEDKKYMFLDLAMPRDIDPLLATYNNVTIFNLDDVWEVYNKHLYTRDTLLEKYSFLIDEQMKNLKKWFNFYRERKSQIA